MVVNNYKVLCLTLSRPWKAFQSGQEEEHPQSLVVSALPKGSANRPEQRQGIACCRYEKYKRDSPTRFSTSWFLSLINQTTWCSTDQAVKIFTILVKNLLRYWNFKFKRGVKKSVRIYTPVSKFPWGLIPGWMNIPRVCMDPASQSPQGLIPWDINLPGCDSLGESISLGP